MSIYNFNKFLMQNKSYINSIDALFTLKTNNTEEIDKIYQDIEDNLINSKNLLPSQVLEMISSILPFNNRYFRSYWELFKLIFEEYRPKYEGIHPLFYYLIYKEYGIGFE